MKHQNNISPIVIDGVSVDASDNFDRALRKFTKKSQESGRLKEAKERMFYESPSEKKKRKAKAARKRWLKKQVASKPKKDR